MTELVRTWHGTVRVRADAADPSQRIIEGVVVPFGQVATVRDSEGGPIYRESIARSAVDGLDPSRVLFDYLTEAPAAYNTHAGSRLAGRGIAAEPTDSGLAMAFRVARTAAGDEALELAREGILTDLSVMFTPRSERRREDGVLERTGIDVRRVTLVERGAYQGAQVTAVRAATEGDMPNTPAAAAATTNDDDETTTDQPAPTPAPAPAERPNRTRITVDVERAIADEVSAQLARAGRDPSDQARAAAEREATTRLGRRGAGAGISITRPEAIYGPGSGRSFFRDLWISRNGGDDPEARGRVERHYAMLADIDAAIQRSLGFDQGVVARAGDVLSSEIVGAYPNEYLPGLLVSRILRQRPMAGFYQRFPLEDGRPRIYPVVSTSTTVAAQGAEGVNPAASDFATTGTTITPVFYGGETKVSRQVLDGADPSTDVMLQTDLTEAYMQASEAIVRAAVEAGSAASGVTLTAATPDAGIRALLVNYLGNVFIPAERVFLPTTLVNSWLTQNDSTGRPLAPAINPSNSDSEATIELPLIGRALNAPVAQSWSSTAGAGAGVGGVAVAGRASDFAIFESNLANFDFREGAEAPSAVRIGLWAYLVVGTRRGSRKATGA